MPDKLNYQNWFHKGDNDELSAEVVLREGAPPIACFLSQQLAEKYLKGLYSYFRKLPPKTHDLTELAEGLAKEIGGVNEFEEDFAVLNRYYIETRYPDDLPEPMGLECAEALEAARRIKEFVISKVKS